ncbi:Acyl carrier protein-like [Mycena sanguinolenta]|uniref:Acyl carrier protein-like n=1 Tax=Mycena sanguinolenta TaxID=230812 RepID=A0A8H6Z5W5_9AGAR|nr:Acyl carrier protein-like [Mycena sanguinolenta]
MSEKKFAFEDFLSHPLPAMEPYDDVPAPHPAAVASAYHAYDQLNSTFPGLVADFEEKYAAWEAIWYTGENAISSHSATRAQGPEFEALVALGPKIIPLVVKKLAMPENEHMFAVELYNVLEKDERVKVHPEHGAPSTHGNLLDYCVLQRQANLLVDMNDARTQAINSKHAAWYELCESVAHSSNSSSRTESDEYEDLLGMGASAIPQHMLEYANNPDGWHHELLHETVHGQRSGTGTWFKDREYQQWVDWFEHKDYRDAPKSSVYA